MKSGLWVDGRNLRTKNGSVASIRGIEAVLGKRGSTHPGTIFRTCIKFKANCILSVFSEHDGLMNYIFSNLVIAKLNNMVVGINTEILFMYDFLYRKEFVSLLNSFDNTYIELSRGDGRNSSEIKDIYTREIKALREIGHLSPIKIFPSMGGRKLKDFLDCGHSILENDPEKNVIFSWNAYWGLKTGSWTYQEDNGFTPGIGGTIEACKAIYDSGLCFIVSLSGEDDIGATGFEQLAPVLHQYDIGWTWSSLHHIDTYKNGLVEFPLSDTINDTYGPIVEDLFRVQSKPILL